MSREQARRVTDWRRERRWERVELKDRQQGDGGQGAVSVTPDADGTGSGSLLEQDTLSHL